MGRARLNVADASPRGADPDSGWLQNEPVASQPRRYQVSLRDGWLGLTRLTEGGWKFGIERPSEAIDWYSIPDGQTSQLAAFLRVEISENTGGHNTADESIVAAWGEHDGKTLEMLEQAGVTPLITGVWIPGGDYGYSYEVGDDRTLRPTTPTSRASSD